MLCFQPPVSDNGGPHYALPLAGITTPLLPAGPSAGTYSIWLTTALPTQLPLTEKRTFQDAFMNSDIVHTEFHILR
jgi:hypothetical protein